MSIKKEDNNHHDIIIKDRNIYIAFKKKKTQTNPQPDNTKYMNYTSTLMAHCHQILINDNISNMSFEMIYSLCYKICIKKGEKYLAEQFKELLISYLKETYSNEIYYLYSNDMEYFKRIIEIYHYFLSKITIIQKTLMYFEINYLKKNDLKDVKEEAKEIYYSVVITHSIDKLTGFLISMINNCRIKEQSSRQFVFQLMGMMIDLNQSFITDCLKDSFLNNQEKYYHELYDSVALQNDFIERIEYISNCFTEELNYINQCNLCLLKTQLIAKFYDEMVKPLLFTNPSIEELLRPLIMNKNIKVISKIYFLTKIVRGQGQLPGQGQGQGDSFLELLSRVFESIGKGIIRENKILNDQMVINIINEVISFLSVINYISLNLKIDNQLYWEIILKDHLIAFINSSNNLIAKILPKYIDIYFTQAIKPSKHISIDFNVFSINSVIDLFKFIKDKGLFEIQYRKFLGYRLLTNVYQEYQEKNLLSQLMVLCGSMYIRKCETMLNDIKESNEFVSKHHNERITPVNIDFQIKILTSGNWELKKNEVSKHDSLYLSNEAFNKEFSHLNCIKLIRDFFSFYMERHPNTVIHHYLSIGHCEVNAVINTKAYSIISSPIQSLFCMLFNKSNSLRRITIKKLQEIFLIKDKDRIIEIIKPLVANKLFLFEDECYLFNRDYNNKGGKIIVNSKNELAKMAIEENEVNQTLLKQNNIIVESVIIRIMKTKRKITHVDLVTELIKSIVDFAPDVTMIKNRIELLIERGYMSRDCNELNTYLYIV